MRAGSEKLKIAEAVAGAVWLWDCPEAVLLF